MNRFETVFEFTPELRPSNQRPEIQDHQALVLQGFRHIAIHNSLGQTFSYGGFSDPGFADKDGIVLGPSRKYLNDPPYFLVPANDWIEFLPGRKLRQVSTVFFERPVFPLGFGILDPGTAAYLFDRSEQGFTF